MIGYEYDKKVWESMNLLDEESASGLDVESIVQINYEAIGEQVSIDHAV